MIRKTSQSIFIINIDLKVLKYSCVKKLLNAKGKSSFNSPLLKAEISNKLKLSKLIETIFSDRLRGKSEKK